jgi:tetraacyldisaccharide 4'-kinase
VSSAALEELKLRIKSHVEAPQVFELAAKLAGFAGLNNGAAMAPHDLSKRKVLLASGIGRPEGFEYLLSDHVEIVGHEIFRDHHPYTAADFVRIEEHAERVGVDTVVVTEKDAVKMRTWPPGRVKVWAARMEFSGRLEGLYAALDRLIS